MVIQSLLPDDHIDLTHAVEFRRSTQLDTGVGPMISVSISCGSRVVSQEQKVDDRKKFQ